MLSLVGILLFLLYSNFAVANPFATPDDFSAASCPINHKMYYLGSNPPTSTSAQPVVALPLSWTAGNTSKEFTFADNKIFTIAFPILIDANNSNGTVPFYGSINDATSNAINLVHNSTRVQTDHSLELSINRPVSKIGYKIQDLDSTTVRVNVGSFFFPRYENRAPYIEQVDVSANNGQLTFNNIFHNINAQRNIVTAKEGENCDTGECTIDAAWGYKPANSVVNLKHSNTKRETSGSHATGYSDFYFCLAPPKIIVKKALSGNRINDTDAKRDQFEIKATGGSIAANSFTTTGNAAAVTNNSSVVLELSENTSYKITERVMNGNTLGDIANYEATYVCNNATTGSTTVMPTTAMTYDATTKTRSFTLANANYGDEITCTITNGPTLYNFSGIVFDDNGGIASTRADKENADITTTASAYSNNSTYFNGVFNTPPETGIAGSSVKLVSCTNTNTIYANQSVVTTGTTIGRYQFSLPISTFGGNNNLCLIESRTGDTHPIRTSNENKNVGFAPTNFNYPDNDFGRVIDAHAAIVLKKYQYVNDCDTTLNYSAISITADPRTGFSTGTVSESLIPGQCIAYKIVATNRANISVDNFVMRDVLQSKGVKNATTTSVLVAPVDAASNYAGNSVAIGMNGTVISNSQSIPARKKRDFYFNTKYGTTSNP
ncbi:hypothetical protein [Psychrobacter glacincola]|uniref:SpaA-like prealbumin fold domain-containing protein n=1 Tax=Psychrobacter glacincola TaxID=56810 RepID=A0ABW1W8Y1_9GAMM|nr:hypothetical protein [Psychrobacter glacincola]|tara:strand:+ start:4362 stop:6353 length:1992 start_codon:yes stop_codon:yes gene_type:complete